MLGRSDWIYQKWGKERNLSKILAISQHAMQSWCCKLREGQNALGQKVVSQPGKRSRTKARTSKLRKGLGLNITVNVGVWFCNDDFCKRKPEGKKLDFLRFSVMLEMVIFVLVQINKKKQKSWFFSRLLDIPIWGTFYSMLTTDSQGNVCQIEKAAMF